MRYFDETQFEFVLIRTADGDVFARLVSMLTVLIEEKPYPVALVQPFASYSGPKAHLDKDLGFL